MKKRVLYFSDMRNKTPLHTISDSPLNENDIISLKHEEMEIDEKAAIVIKTPENRRELKRFIDLIHPKLSWIIWWEKRYGCNNWRRRHGLPLTRRMPNRKRDRNQPEKKTTDL